MKNWKFQLQKMKIYILLSFSTLLFFLGVAVGKGQPANKKQGTAHALYLSLNGEVMTKGNPVDADGNIRRVNMPLLRLTRTRLRSAKGTILLLPGGGYAMLQFKNEGKKAAAFLNSEGFDVAILDYHIGISPEIPDLALTDALKAFRLLKLKSGAFGLRGNRLDIAGLSSGGHLAARTVQRLAADEQPDNICLVSPPYLNETLSGTVMPAVMPPVNPSARLFTAFSVNDDKAFIAAGSEYVKTWRGYNGAATFSLLPDSVVAYHKGARPGADQLKLTAALRALLNQPPVVKGTGLNPAAVPVSGYNRKRHEEKLALVAAKKFGLIMIGNSITNNFEKPEYKPVWDQFFAPRNALNLGYSGYRTENIIWNLQNGELDGQSPKVVVLEIGTNNVDEKNYPTRHTAGQLAGGITAIVKLLRQRLPDTKIIVLRCFPGCYGGPNPTSHRAILERASDIVSKLADGEHIFYCDVNHVFLNMDGSINHAQLQDWLHPSPAGAKAWAQAMEPLLSKLMGDTSLDREIPANTAIVPVPKLEEDSYNWWDRHAEVMRIKDRVNPEIILIGNSITHFWGGQNPVRRNADGSPMEPNGPKSWSGLFGPYRVLNLGFGWDRTQNVLWRLDHGEIDGLHPRVVVINIGTNNTSQTTHARMNTAAEIVEGIHAVCMRVRSKVPGAKIVLMAVFPREQDPLSPRRVLINEINRQLAIFANENKITLVDLGPGLLASDGTFLPGMMLDYTHPTDKGYQVWADSIRKYVDAP
jgi:lysophospholipase L1-like esterase/acetyl esterase/lipase